MSHIKYELCLLCISSLLVLIILMLFFKAIINNTSVSTLAVMRIAIFQLSTKFQTAIRVVSCCRVDRFDGYSDDLFSLELLFSRKGNLALLSVCNFQSMKSPVELNSLF